MAEPQDKNAFATTPPEMTVLSDHAIYRDSGEHGDADHFELEAKLGLAFDVLRHKKTQEPITIAIYGDWGVGKTSSMQWLRKQLEDWSTLSEEERDGHPRTRTIWFEPWKYQTREDVWRGLIAEVILKTIDVSGADFTTVKSAVRRFGGFLGRSFLNVLASTKLKAGVDATGVEVDLSELRTIVDDFQATNHPEKAYLNEFEETFKEWVQARLAADERMVLFIDDLDRCLPGVTLEVLEALKLYLNIPKLVFVVGLDRGVVDAIVRKHYEGHGVEGLKAGQYLDKIFQVEVNISPSQHQIKEFIEFHVASLDRASGGIWDKHLAAASNEIDDARDPKESTDAKQIIESQVERLCRDNPREVKRLLNSILMRSVAASRGTGAGSKALRFAQGAQVFLIDRYIRRDFIGAENELLRAEVQAFFEKWSKFLNKFPDFEPRSGDAGDETEVAKQWREVEEAVEGVSSSYSELRKSIPHYTVNDKSAPLDVLDVPVFRDLMRIPFDPAVAAYTALPSIEHQTEKSPETADHTRGSAPRLSPFLRNKVAQKLDLPAGSLKSEHLAQVEGLDLGVASGDIIDLEGIDLLTNVRSLYLTQTSTTDDGLEYLQKLPNLKELVLSGTEITNNGLEQIRELTTLTQLTLWETAVTDEGLEGLQGLTNLTQLTLWGTAVTDNGLKCLKKLPNLSRLALGATKVTDDGLKYLQEIANLNGLSLTGTKVTDNGLKHLQELTNLNELELMETTVTDEGLKHLQKLANLARLDLRRTAVTNEGLKYLEELANLNELHLGLTKITNGGLKHLHKFSNLTQLGLTGTAVTDEGLKHLQKLCSLTRLALGATKVTDAGLKYLEELANLNELILRRTKVTDEGLKHLQKLTNLTQLNLQQTRVTKAGVARLKDTMPNLEVIR